MNCIFKSLTIFCLISCASCTDVNVSVRCDATDTKYFVYLYQDDLDSYAFFWNSTFNVEKTNYPTPYYFEPKKVANSWKIRNSFRSLKNSMLGIKAVVCGNKKILDFHKVSETETLIINKIKIIDKVEMKPIIDNYYANSGFEINSRNIAPRAIIPK